MIAQVAQPPSYPWIIQRLGLRPSAEFQALEAIREDGSIAGMVGYDAWTPGGVTLSIALDTPMAFRCLVKPLFLMAFEVCRREVATCVVRSDNRASLALVEHVGFRRAGVVPNGWAPGIDLTVWQMQKRDCRWLYGKNRKAA